MNYKVLVIEDEEAIRKFIRINFERDTFEVLEASSGEDGLKIALEKRPEIVILDIMLPGMDGFKAFQLLRESLPNAGIIMLTAKVQDIDKIMGLEFGADDYMVKPFNPLELIARTKALLRRITRENESNTKLLISGSIKVDTLSRKVYKNDIPLELTPS